MEIVEYAMHTTLFALALWLKCTVVGGIIGGSVAAVQIFAGKWHPAWASRLFSWFAYPLYAGLAAGVVLALATIPPLSAGRFFWLLFCLAASSAAAAFVAGALASLTRNYDLKIAKTARGNLHRRSGAPDKRSTQWKNRLHSLFDASPEADAATLPRRRGGSHAPPPRQKTKLPPERFPFNPASAKNSHYAGHPREEQIRQGKSEKPDK